MRRKMSSTDHLYQGESNQIETTIEIQLTNRDKKSVFFRGILIVPMVIFLSSFTQSVNVGV